MGGRKTDDKKSALRSISGNASSLLKLKRKKKPLRRIQRSLTSDEKSNEYFNEDEAHRSNDVENSFRSSSIIGSHSSLELNDSDSDLDYSITRNNVVPSVTGTSIKNIKINSSRVATNEHESKSSFAARQLTPLSRNKDTLGQKSQLSVPDISIIDSPSFKSNENVSTDPLSLRLGKSGSKTNLDASTSVPNSMMGPYRSNNSSHTKNHTEEGGGESGILSSILSAAHNAANHLMPKNALKSSEANDAIYEEDNRHKTTPNDSVPSASSSTRNTGFLNHLDFLLATTNDNDVVLNKTTTLSTINLDTSGGNSPFQPHGSSTEENEDEGEDVFSITDGNSIGTNLDNVKFRSVKSDSEPPISTFGKGDLTLDAVDKFNSGLSSTPKVITPPDISESAIDSFPLASKINSDRFSKSLSLLSLPRAPSPGSLEMRPVSPEPAMRSRSKTRKNTGTTMDTSFRSFSPNNAATKLLPFRHSFTGRVNNNTSKVHDGTSSNHLSRISTSDIPARKEKHGLFDLQGVEYASAKKNAEFHSIFNDTVVSPVDRLIADFSCALSKDILIQGKLFISDRHLCFYSNILGWVKSIIVPFKEIVQIEQKNTAMLFRNAISVQTLHEKFLFTSFMSRDAAFDLIMSVWNQTILNKHSTKVDAVNSDLNDGSSTYGSDSINERYEAMGDFDSNPSEEDEEDESDDINSDEMTSGSESEPTPEDENVNGFDNHIKKTILLEKVPSIDSITTLGVSKHEPTIPTYEPRSSERDVGEATFKAPLGKVINILFGSDTSFMEAILKAQGNYDISSLHELLRSKKREMTYTKPINGSIGPSKTKCEITETVEHFDLEDYVQILQVSRTPDIPSGNSFSVKTIYLFSWAENSCTKLKVYAYVEWTSKSWIKAAVEKGSFDGIQSSTKVFIDELNRILSDSKSKLGAGKKSNDSEAISNLPKFGPQEHRPTSNTFEKGSGYEILEENLNFKIPVGTTFQLLCGDDRTYLKRILERQKNFDISDIPKFESKSRKYEYTKPLNGPIGPKQTRCLIQEVIESDDVESCIVWKQISKTPDVPSGNSFEVHTKFYISWGEKNSTNMLVATKVEWSGKSWIKGAVEKGSLNGQKTGIQDMVAEIKDIISSSKSRKPSGWVSKRKFGRTRSKRKSIPKEPLAEPDKRGTLLEMIVNLDFAEMTLVTKLGIAVFFLILLLVTLLISNVLRGKKNTARLVDRNTILFDGHKYHVVPSLDTLDTRYGDRSRSEKAEKMVLSSEFDIWNWINDRQGTFQAVDARDKIKAHKKQDLDEIIRLTEMKLEQLKKMARETS